MNIRRNSGQVIITWRMWLIVSVTAFGVYLGGVTSGYYIARAEYASQLTVLQSKVEQIPQRTADKVQKAVTEEEKAHENQR